MPRLVIFLVVLFLFPLEPVFPQETVVAKPGSRIRVTAPECGPTTRQMTIHAVMGDSLFLREESDEFICPSSAVERLEVYWGRRSWGKGATVGALVGGAVGCVVGGLVGDKDHYPTFDPRTAAAGLGIGATIGAVFGKGPRARKSVLVGTGISPHLRS